MRRRNDDIYDWQLTDADVELCKAIGIPKILRPNFKGGASEVNARTRVGRQMAAMLQVQANIKEQEIRCIEAEQKLDELAGEVTSAEKWRVQAIENGRQRDEALAELSKERKLNEINTANSGSAIATHAAPTGR